MQNNLNSKSLDSKGFTLVELSIVIVIIGFLIAGISAGSNLIKQSQLRSVITDFNLHAVSYNNFLSKFSKIPGDMDNGYAIWSTNCAASAAVCNGNNDGYINYDSASTSNNEINKAWKHLQLAGMTSAGIAVVSATTTAPGVNAPASKISGAGYIMAAGSTGTGFGAAAPFPKTTNAVMLGKATTSDTLLTAAIAPDDAFSIDQKIDDGSTDSSGNFTGGVSGSVRSVDGSGVTAGNCVASATGYYNMSNSGTVNCRIGMALN